MISDWHGLYSEGWKGEITPEAFAHPAKYSRALIRHIYLHMLEEGWLRTGNRVIDPFGGVALGARDAMALGLDWLGVELEPRFVELGNQNIVLWEHRLRGVAQRGTARLVQGDSRELAAFSQQPATISVSSPPYSEARIGQESGQEQCGHNDQYGATPGQLGAMRAGDWQAAVSSPPFEKVQGFQDKTFSDQWGPKQSRTTEPSGYGSTAGNIGNATGDTFWTAARQIVEQVYQVLEPGGHAAWVVKGYVKNKQLVDFPGQWQALCEAAGFTTLHIHRAWLVEERGMQFDLEGNGHSKQVERKSFFRRLAEQKGSPRIDFETVICMEKR